MNQKLKILYVITQGGPWGGAQKYVYDLATALPSDWDVTVAVGEPDGPRELQERFGLLHRKEQIISVVQLQHLGRAISPLRDLRAMAELRRLYKTIQPAVVHLNSSKAGVIGSLAAIGLPQINVVYTAHGWVFTEPVSWIKRELYLIAEWATARLKDGIIVLSKSDERLAQGQLGLPAKKLHFIPLGIERPAEKSPPRDRPVRPPERYPIVCVANFFPNKGVDILIRAFAQAFPNDTQVSLTLIGEGPERENIARLIASLNLEKRVALTGFLSYAADLLPDFDLFVLPSRKEGLPYALLEAIAAGIPVVATAVGDVSNHIINKTTGLLVPGNNVTALAGALQYAKNHPDEMKAMSEAGLKQIREAPTTEDMRRTTTSLYQSLVPAAKSNP